MSADCLPSIRLSLLYPRSSITLLSERSCPMSWREWNPIDRHLWTPTNFAHPLRLHANYKGLWFYCGVLSSEKIILSFFWIQWLLVSDSQFLVKMLSPLLCFEEIFQAHSLPSTYTSFFLISFFADRFLRSFRLHTKPPVHLSQEFLLLRKLC